MGNDVVATISPVGVLVAGITALAVPAALVWWVATTFATYKWARAELKELEDRQFRLETAVTAVQMTSASIQMELTYIRKGVDAVNDRIDRALGMGVNRHNPQCAVASDKPANQPGNRYSLTDSQIRRLQKKEEEK